MLTQQQARAKMFTDQASMAAFFKAYERQTGPMLAYCEAVMGADSSLTMAEKYLLGAYVSELNHCVHCRNVQESAALSCGVDEGILKSLLLEKETPLAPRMMSVFQYAKKLSLTPHQVGVEDSQAVLSHGWPKEALSDVVHIVGLFSMLTRLIEGLHIRPEVTTSISMGTYLAREGYSGMAADHGLENPYVQPLAPGEGIPSLRRISREADHMVPGVKVRLQNLQREVHNGKIARVLEYVPHADNWRVELENAVVIRVNAENCTIDTDDDEYPPLSTASVESREVEVPEIGTVSNAIRKAALARNRFQRIESRLLKDFSSPSPLSNCTVELNDKFEVVYFTINSSWDKGRKALFAKTYTRHYKDGVHRLRVVIVDSDDKKSGKTITFDDRGEGGALRELPAGDSQEVNSTTD